MQAVHCYGKFPKLTITSSAGFSGNEISAAPGNNRAAGGGGLSVHYYAAVDVNKFFLGGTFRENSVESSLVLGGGALVTHEKMADGVKKDTVDVTARFESNLAKGGTGMFPAPQTAPLAHGTHLPVLVVRSAIAVPCPCDSTRWWLRLPELHGAQGNRLYDQSWRRIQVQSRRRKEFRNGRRRVPFDGLACPWAAASSASLPRAAILRTQCCRPGVAQG